MKNHDFANLVIPSAHATACCQDYGVADCTCDLNSIDFHSVPIVREFVCTFLSRLGDLLSVLMCMEIYVIDLLVRRTRSSAFLQDRSLCLFSFSRRIRTYFRRSVVRTGWNGARNGVVEQVSHHNKFYNLITSSTCSANVLLLMSRICLAWRRESKCREKKNSN